MGITKILMKRGVVAAGIVYDVLIPLPANHDECMKAIGINEFEDADDEWDENFCEIVECLTGGEKFQIEAINPDTGEKERIDKAGLSDIPGFLAYNDHLNFLIKTEGKSITFTRGHEIFWLEGFFTDRIKLLRFPIKLTDNEKIAELF